MRCIFLYVGLLVSLGLSAQEAPRIRNFVPTEYHSQNQNWALVQGAQGWMYAGNNGGMLEFDGSTWQTFSMPENQTVRAVATGSDNRIYCGGFAEFGYWQPTASGQMNYHSLSQAVRSDRLGKEEIWHILVCDKFVLFQSFSTVYKYDYQKVTILQPPSSIMFARSVAGRVLVPVIGRGLYELLPDNSFRFVTGTEPLADKIVQFLVPHGAGIWAGTTNHGIFLIENDQCLPWNKPLNAVFQKYQLNKAVALEQGGWAIGTILNGVFILDAFENLSWRLNRENGLQNNTVLALFEDRQGNLWVGLDRGIDLIALNSPMTIFTDLTGKIGTVYTAAVWNQRLYIGTNQGVFVRENNIFRLVEGTQGQVWELRVFAGQLLCGHNAGTYLIEGQRARLISDVTGGWCTVPVPGQAGQLLVQSTYTGLVVFRCPPGGRWQPAFRVAGFNEPLKKILFDGAGKLWGSHPNKGLFRLRLSPDLKQVLEYKSFTREDGLPTDFKLDLATIGDMPVVNAQYFPLRIADSAGQVVFQPLCPPARRQKWLPGSGAQYFTLDSSGVALQAQGHTYPLPVSLVPGFENIVDLGAKEYLFCQENGFAILDKGRMLRPPPGLPAVQIRRLESSGGGAVELGKELEFSYHQNNLKFRFATPYYYQMPTFSWYLDGYSKTWSPWQTNPEKEFANLPPGKYELHVRADVGGAEALLAFRIRAPWYQSGWAMAGYGLLLIGIFALIENISRSRLERQRQRLVSEKLQELTRQRSEAEREMLALEIQNKNRELSNAALNLIRKNEALQRLRDELLQVDHTPGALQKLARLIDRNLEGDHDWELFEESFNRVHDDFFKRLMQEFPDLTPGDLRLAAYLKMNLSSKEIAPLLNISVRGVENKRYRLRKKLGLPEDANLTEYIMGY